MGFKSKIEIGGNISKKILDEFEKLFKKCAEKCIISKGKYEGEFYLETFEHIEDYLKKNKINHKMLCENDESNQWDDTSTITYRKYISPFEGESKEIKATCRYSNPQVYFKDLNTDFTDIMERLEILKSSVQFLMAYIKKSTKAIPLFTKDENIKDLIKTMLDNSKDPYDILTEYTDNLFCEKIPEIDPLNIIK